MHGSKLVTRWFTLASKAAKRSATATADLREHAGRVRVRTTSTDRTEGQRHATNVKACLFSLVTLTALVGLPSVATMAVADQSALTTFEFPGAIRTIAEGINACGDIVGSYGPRNEEHGFLLSGGEFTPIDVPGATFTSPRGISSSGDIVGRYTDADGTVHGFLLSADGWTPIDVPGATRTAASGINRRGDIVGLSGPMLDDTHGFLLSGGTFTPINIPGASATIAWGTNSRGDIVGEYGPLPESHGFLLSGHEFTPIDVPRATRTAVHGINPRGDMVGDYRSADGNTHGFLLSKQGHNGEGDCEEEADSPWPPEDVFSIRASPTTRRLAAVVGRTADRTASGSAGGVWIHSTATVGLVETDVTDNFASTSDADVFGDFSQECVF